VPCKTKREGKDRDKKEGREGKARQGKARQGSKLKAWRALFIGDLFADE